MSLQFDIQPTKIEGLVLLQRKPLGDKRGYLERLFCQWELMPLLKGKNIVQINHTVTYNEGTVRGLHFQYPPHAETKFVSCIRGKVFDVAVDLREGSSTFLQYHAVTLTEENSRTFLIPEGFAHGFQTLSKNCEMLYFHTETYHPDSEGALNATDTHINIKWPLEITERSERDQSHSIISSSFKGIRL